LNAGLAAAGYRKVYCTAPTTKPAAVSYLLKTGYRIEAHLSRQYHHAHDELVFGTELQAGSVPQAIPSRPILIGPEITKVGAENAAEAAAFLQREFEASYFRVTPAWVARQIAIAQKPGKQGLKPRFVFAATGVCLVALCICILKRGGAAKLILLSGTSHVGTLTSLITAVSKEARRLTNGATKRTYTHVPVMDGDLLSAFLSMGYRPEGVIRQPFRRSVDVVALAKPAT
jgi:hypothetical protein